MNTKFKIDDKVYWLNFWNKGVKAFPVRITDVHISMSLLDTPNIDYRFSFLHDPLSFPDSSVGYHSEKFFFKTIEELKAGLLDMLIIEGEL